jgi:hypothetical protein
MLGGDYICYRLYCYYRKHHRWKECEEIHSFGLMYGLCAIYTVVAAVVISGFICSAFFKKNDFDTVFGWTTFVCIVACLVLLNRRYNPKRMAVLVKKYRNDQRNKAIADWMLIPIIPLYVLMHVVIIIFIIFILKLSGGSL